MNKTRTLYVAWQAPTGRRWFPIGRLTYDGEWYRYNYTKGALEAQQTGEFERLEAFPVLTDQPKATELFPFFENRVMNGNRPEFDEFLKCLKLEKEGHDPIALLGRSGGRRATDSLELFPLPEPDRQGNYHLHFFVHGLRHFPEASSERVSLLKAGDTLRLMHDVQNNYDEKALALRSDDAGGCNWHLLGWLPRYLSADASKLLKADRESVEVRVERVNLSAPLQLRLLCSLTASWPSAGPFSTEQYQPLA